MLLKRFMFSIFVVSSLFVMPSSISAQMMSSLDAYCPSPQLYLYLRKDYSECERIEKRCEDDKKASETRDAITKAVYTSEEYARYTEQKTVDFERCLSTALSCKSEVDQYQQTIARYEQCVGLYEEESKRFYSDLEKRKVEEENNRKILAEQITQEKIEEEKRLAEDERVRIENELKATEQEKKTQDTRAKTLNIQPVSEEQETEKITEAEGEQASNVDLNTFSAQESETDRPIEEKTSFRKAFDTVKSFFRRLLPF
ncbi:hypothetical protein A3C87_01395 [Candidatus Kaiserbacteria bacterium RIFCSPHIGHO2_02_FULL_49_34]|uniref:DUF5667 domain-containing protein n=1 Tax=Candidatus Kaiserbacteria bacterium RIFCSPHIGHO2_02_FULL_49_34 TaxID=1798491 RepID=A0A1F6DN83_9BACT|nr:MAG: hypothetical protein A3C87_01395 [Candidatus Kaiserbacteria bacterium RIFCSPHIGHO2_02_FULL_49_34]